MGEDKKTVELMVTIPPSINACYANARTFGRRGRILTAAARNWKETAGWAAKAAKSKAGWEVPAAEEKIVLELVAYWPDRRRHDMNNVHKLLCDAFEGILYQDDCMVMVRDMDFYVDRKHPRLEVKLYKLGEECP